MALIGSLVTNVKANTDQFKKKMTAAANTTVKFGAAMKRVAKAGAVVGAGLAAIALGGLVVFTKQAFSAIDATAKLAAQLEISTEALIGYQLAAGLSGTDTETLNKALLKMAKIVGEAKSGISTGTKALEDFGMKIEDLEGLTTQEIFEKFSEEISKIEDPMERAAKASLIFGKSGQKLMSFLQLGEKGLAEVRKEVKALGIDFTNIDAAQVEAANDAMLKLQTVAEGLGNVIAIKLSPFITAATNKLLEFIKEGGGIRNITLDAIKPLVTGIGFLLDILELGKAAWSAFATGAKVAIAGILTPLAAIEEAMNYILRQMGQPIPSNPPIAALLEKMKKSASESAEEFTKAKEAYEKKIRSKEAEAFFERIIKKAEETARTITGAGEAASGTSRREEFLKGKKKKKGKGSKEREFITVDLKNISLGGPEAKSGKKTDEKILDENKKQTAENKKQTAWMMAIAKHGVAGRGTVRAVAQ